MNGQLKFANLYLQPLAIKEEKRPFVTLNPSQNEYNTKFLEVVEIAAHRCGHEGSQRRGRKETALSSGQGLGSLLRMPRGCHRAGLLPSEYPDQPAEYGYLNLFRSSKLAQSR
jgi:hypothetical protein